MRGLDGCLERVLWPDSGCKSLSERLLPSRVVVLMAIYLSAETSTCSTFSPS
jgi:hypothetical protein